MKDLINELQELIQDYYNEELKTYSFKSSDAEDDILTMIDDLKEEVASVVLDANFQIECELNDATAYTMDKEIIELDKYRI